MQKKIYNHFFSLIIAFFVIGIFPQRIVAQQQDSIKEPVILLSSKMLNDIRLNIKLMNSFDITPRGEVLLSTSNQFYLLKWEEIIPLDPKMGKPINSFSYTPDNLLVIVSDSSLCYMDRFSQFVELYKLPKKNMEITTGDSSLYVYDKTAIVSKSKAKQKQRYAIYMIPKNQKYIKLLELPTPITSVIEAEEGILISTKNKVYSVNIKTRQIKELINLSKINGDIVSMTRDVNNDVIYFSTNNAIYLFKEKKTYRITNEFTGVVKYYLNQLFVFNAEKKFLILFETENTKLSK